MLTSLISTMQAQILQVGLQDTTYKKHVLAGTELRVGEFSLEAQLEDIELQQVQVYATGNGSQSFAAAVIAVTLLDENYTEIVTEFATDSVVSFNMSYILPQGGNTMYVKITTEEIGHNNNGVPMDDVQMRLQVTEARGVQSSNAATLIHDDGNWTLAAPKWDVVPVRIANVQLVSQFAGQQVTPFVSGQQVEQAVAIIAIYADAWQNTSQATGALLELVLDYIKITNSNPSGVEITNTKLKVINGNLAPIAGQPLGNGRFQFDTDTIVLESAQTIYLKVEADIYVRQTGSFRIDIAVANTDVSYRDNDSNWPVLGLRFFAQQLTGVTIPVEFVCPGTRALTGVNLTTEKVERAEQVESSEIILPLQNVEYSGQVSTTLLPGFEIQPGGTLTISTTGCN